jgi:pimeloyl-ACP methyl ester carboxylesterase
MTATVVLVHGAWHGAWCWERIVGPLSAAGIPVVAVDLPGHGADPGPLGDLHADADRVRSVLDELTAPVVLVGHSYGGVVVTEAGEHPSVTHVVYLAALALDADETATAAVVEEAAAAQISHEGRLDIGPGLIIAEDGTMTVEPAVAAAALYNECDQPTVDWALARLGPQPIVTMQQQPAAVAWRSRPSTYVVCSRDMIIHPELQRIMAKRCTSVVEWDTDHSPFLSRPHELIDLLTDLARA